MTLPYWPALVRWVQRIFAPSGNLLVADLAAEITVHVLANGTRKTLINKIESQATAHQAVQGLVFGAIEVGKAHGVAINWEQMNRVAPYPGPLTCEICKGTIAPNEPCVWSRNPAKTGHIKCAVVVEDGA